MSGLCDEARRVIQERQLTPEPYVQQLTYDYWPAEHVLKVRCTPSALAPAAAPDGGV